MRVVTMEKDFGEHKVGCGRDWKQQHGINKVIVKRLEEDDKRLTTLELTGARMSGVWAAIGGISSGILTVFVTKWVG